MTDAMRKSFEKSVQTEDGCNLPIGMMKILPDGTYKHHYTQMRYIAFSDGYQAAHSELMSLLEMAIEGLQRCESIAWPCDNQNYQRDIARILKVSSETLADIKQKLGE